ncbi:MAG: hypothetical protein ILO36_01150 [Abditibacteriota bacterium]|nr:hypothetical protein [Abditibacteriota bacterium]
MKGTDGWSFAPYTPLHRPERAEGPYITRLAPFAGGFEADIINNSLPGSAHTVYYGKRGSDAPTAVSARDTVRIEGLEDDTDYELFARDLRGRCSSRRLVRTGEVPGEVINYLHPEDEEFSFSGRYLCSPSLLRLPSGTLLSSMDVFAPEAPQNLTLLYESRDGGAHWRYVADLFPCFWGKLFMAKGALYMLAVSDEYGDLLIGRSEDEGRTWSAPSVILRGSSNSREIGVHRAPMPLLLHNGVFYTDFQYGAWNKNVFYTGVLSVREDADLLDPAAWTVSGLWDPLKEPGIVRPGGIEGNIVAGPDGRLYDFMRYKRGEALVLSFDPQDPEKAPVFDRVAAFPSVDSKFNVIFDSVSGKYISLVNYDAKIPRTTRNLLSLVWSEDLKDWRLGSHIIDRSYMDPGKVAFQYTDFFIEGGDILFQSRTAMNGAHNFHDADFATFHRLPGFRSRLEKPV